MKVVKSSGARDVLVVGVFLSML